MAPSRAPGRRGRRSGWRRRRIDAGSLPAPDNPQDDLLAGTFVQQQKAGTQEVLEPGVHPAASAIEPLARRLGTTKGSFYHHFANRDALIAAALARWEQAATEEPIKHLDLIRDPRDRLRVLATATLTHRQGGLRDAALSASADHPLVKPVLQRVTTRRMAFIADVYAELGWPPDQAQRRALLVYSSYVGLFHYLRAAPPPGLSDDQLKAYAEELIAALVQDPP